MAPPELHEGWEAAPELDDLRERARAIVQEAFGKAELWAWKDPRACLTLPFWQRILPPMHYVLCVRSPADVARSLARRNRVSHERSVYLWLLYTRQALLHTADKPCHLAIYDRLMDEPLEELAALGRFIDAPARANQMEVRDEVSAFLDSGLRHHRGGASGEAANVAHAGDRTAALEFADRAYAALTDHEEFEPAEVHELLQAGLRAVRPGITPRPT